MPWHGDCIHEGGGRECPIGRECPVAHKLGNRAAVPASTLAQRLHARRSGILDPLPILTIRAVKVCHECHRPQHSVGRPCPMCKFVQKVDNLVRSRACTPAPAISWSYARVYDFPYTQGEGFPYTHAWQSQQLRSAVALACWLHSPRA